MPELVCKNCGAITNSAVADHIGCEEGIARFCYAKLKDGKWVAGCKEPSSVMEKTLIERFLEKED